jgi:amino-acid N-acetyltransferase
MSTKPSENPSQDNPSVDTFPFVSWLRTVAPYIHSFHGKTFVIAFAGELATDSELENLVEDIAMLHAMGMNIVLVHGSRPQIQEQLALHSIAPVYGSGQMLGYRITDTATMECVKEAVGELRLDIEACFSQGLPNTPMAGSRISVISGNFITARPVGIVEGVDFMNTGLVRKVDAESIKMSLNHNKIVLLSPLGFSPTGQAFNLAYEDVACATATALKADKLIFLSSVHALKDMNGEHIAEISLPDLAPYLNDGGLPPGELRSLLATAAKAVKLGVNRVHLLPHNRDGAVLEELFTHDGVGTMIVASDIENLREANMDDVGGILQIISPLEDQGVLAPRGRTVIERDISNFSVIEHDQVIFGCAALFPFSNSMGELACLAVDENTQGVGDGERLLKRVEARAKDLGIKKLFVLTTRTEHWFLKRGFVKGSVDELPKERKSHYNWDRKSMVLIKNL